MIFLSAASCPLAVGADTLASGSSNLPDASRPHMFRYWINGNVTREGITADLEAMKRAGIGGHGTRGPVKEMSPEGRSSSTSRVIGLPSSPRSFAAWRIPISRKGL